MLFFIHVRKLQSPLKCTTINIDLAYKPVFCLYLCRAQAGRYDFSKELAEKGKKMEEEELGCRTEQMAEVLYLMAYVADEVKKQKSLIELYEYF